MASIGSGPSVGAGPKLEVNTVRPVGATGAGAVAPEPAPAAASPQVSAQVAAQAATQVSTTALNAGKMPVDNDRVSTIKKAIESGSYPVVPAQISDAMIAAGMLLRAER
jgi:negative regulator of flagellin synthesis FlgM